MVKVSKKWPRRIILDFWRDAWALWWRRGREENREEKDRAERDLPWRDQRGLSEKKRRCGPLVSEDK